MLTNVIVMLRVVSPANNEVYALLAAPPGEQPVANNPRAIAGSR